MIYIPQAVHFIQQNDNYYHSIPCNPLMVLIYWLVVYSAPPEIHAIILIFVAAAAAVIWMHACHEDTMVLLIL